MRRISKLNKNFRGFTLVEMLLVIGIIIILAGAVALGVNDVLNPAKLVQSSVRAAKAEQAESVNQREAKLRCYGV